MLSQSCRPDRVITGGGGISIYSPGSSLKVEKENSGLGTVGGEERARVSTEGLPLLPKSQRFSPEASFLNFILGMGSDFMEGTVVLAGSKMMMSSVSSSS